MKKISAIIILLLLILTGCGNGTNHPPETQDSDILNIYTTLYPLEDFINKVGGEHVNVTSILPAGADAHTYEPTQKTLIDISEADAFIYSRNDIEAYSETIAEALDDENVLMVEAAHNIEMSLHNNHEDHDNHDDNVHADTDPHIWLDPIISIEIVENITKTLSELRPDATDSFKENETMLKQKLQQLDKDFRETLSSVERKQLLVSHAAYGYWEKAYGLEQLSILGLSPTNEPSQRQLENIIEIAEEYDIMYVIFEQNVTQKISNIVKDEIGAEALYLHNLSVLSNEDIKNNEDYFSIMRKNLETLVIALN